jgi:hypothetical protein
MNAADGATTERRIRINRPDEGRGRCKGSRASGRRKDFSQCMQQSTTPSTSNVIIILALLSSPIEAAGSRQPPIPQPRPSLATPSPADPSSKPAPAPPKPPIQPSATGDEQDVSKRCLADLKTLGVEFAPPASQRLDSRCPVFTPVDILSIETPIGRIALPDKLHLCAPVRGLAFQCGSASG